MNELEQAWQHHLAERKGAYGWNPRTVFESGWQAGMEAALKVMRGELVSNDFIARREPDDAHGFAPGEVKEGKHAIDCKDPLCDGCASLEDCAICGYAEFEHGDGSE